MQIQSLRINGQLFNDHFNGSDYIYKLKDEDDDAFATIPVSYSSTSSPLTSPTGLNYVEHRVSRMDTLAGVAIKYGVEVADIKRMNSLDSDLQMFAYKTLQIPLPGKHPPSPCLSNGAEDDGEYTSTRRPGSDAMSLFNTILSKNTSEKVSPTTMNGFCGLGTIKMVSVAEGTELAVYKTTKGYYLDVVDSQQQKGSPGSTSPPSRLRKSRSLANGFSDDSGESKDNSDNERSRRRREKAAAKRASHAPETVMKEDTGNGLSSRISKGLALRTKSGNRTRREAPRPNVVSNGDSFANDEQVTSVRKSISTPSFQDADQIFSLWVTSKWGVKQEVSARPMTDGLLKPVNVRRIKTAMD